MSKVRVYELAKTLGVSSKVLIEKLKELSVEVNSHMSTLKNEDADLVIEIFTGENSSSDSKIEDKTKKIIKEQLPNNENTVTVDEKKQGDISPERKTSKKKNNKKNNKKEKETYIKQNYNLNLESKGDRVIRLGEKIIVKEFAELIEKSVSEVISRLIKMGVMASMNQEIDFETAQSIAVEFGFEVEKNETENREKEENADIIMPIDDEKDLKPRPPVVTVMGHVDHGKTSLLDAIRKTKVTEREAGGITQHIGASEVEINGNKIVFLDTPGHEAFTSMRARGAKVTDIAILVVAADDGVMPQTIEAINHAKAAKVPIIVAINKIDKIGANPDKVKQELSDHGVIIEEWGGDVISVPVSALKGTNIDTLLEMILLVAEMEELKANPNRKAIGTVVEAELDKGRGPIATILVQNGTLKVGDAVVIGSTFGKIRVMINDTGKRVKQAKPSIPVVVTGLSDVPEAGDQMFVVADDKTAREICNSRKERIKVQLMKSTQRVSLDALYSQMQQGQIKELNIIVKADVQGSVEAVKQAMQKLSTDKVIIKTIHGGVGAITESDVMLASASNAIITGFNVRPTSSATALAKKENVDIRTYRIIYNAIEDIEAAMNGMLDPEFEEVDMGKAQVRATFKVPGIGLIAGCYVTEGKIARNAKMRLVRDGIIIHEGSISSLKRFKDDAKEVATGYECGIGIENFNDVKEGDLIEAYKIEEISTGK